MSEGKVTAKRQVAPAVNIRGGAPRVHHLRLIAPAYQPKKIATVTRIGDSFEPETVDMLKKGALTLGAAVLALHPVGRVVVAAGAGIAGMVACGGSGPDGQPLPPEGPPRKLIDPNDVPGIANPVSICTCVNPTLTWHPGSDAQVNDEYDVYDRRLVHEGDVENPPEHFAFIGHAVHPETSMPIHLSGPGVHQVYMTATRRYPPTATHPAGEVYTTDPPPVHEMLKVVTYDLPP